ncbi:MAG: DUF4262 domain-containing protein [Balneola sp.]
MRRRRQRRSKRNEMSINKTRQTIDHKKHDKEAEEFIIRSVKDFGWSIQFFEEENELPSFAYTIGLFEKYKHPEIIAFGLPVNTLIQILNIAGELVKGGKKLKPGKQYEEFLEGFNSTFLAVDKKEFGNYFGYAMWFYDYKEFDAIQYIWPDNSGKYPWQDSFEEIILNKQPLLG